MKALQDNTRAAEYLKLARELPGYGEVIFPHCACDSRKGGHVIVAIGSSSLKLHACREDGTLESQVVELQWDCVSLWEADEEAMAFCLKYNRPDKPPRWLKIFTPYVSIAFTIYTQNSKLNTNFLVPIFIGLLSKNHGRMQMGRYRRMTNSNKLRFI